MADNILEFISIEHHNELASLAILKGELGFLQELDEIYQDTKAALPIDKNNDVQVMVSTMFLQAHSEFFIGMSALLKSNLSKAFISLRIAIDASFNAYYFTKKPEHIKEYVDENSPFQKKIFWRIKDHISKNPKEYPLAQNLVKLHETASLFAGHASLQSIIYKYQYIIDVEQKKQEVKLNYFDKLDFGVFMAYYFGLLKGYFMVFQLFYSCFYKKEFRIAYPDRERRIVTYEVKVNLKGKQYPLTTSKKKASDNRDK